MNFTHLHMHSDKSLIDGVSTPEEIAEIVSSDGQTACALTDHGTIAGSLRFQNACIEQGIKPILGVEAYYIPSYDEDDLDKTRERFHLILLAKNEDGLLKLFETQKRAWTEGFYYKARTCYDDLLYLAGDVVCLSGCMASQLCRLFENDEESAARALAERFKGLFGQDYYIETQPWNYEGLNNKLIDLADSLDIPIVGTLDCHYPHAKDKHVEETLLMIGQSPGMNAERSRHAKEHYKDALAEPDVIKKIDLMYPDRFLNFSHNDNYVMPFQDVIESFQKAGVTRTDIFENTMIVADKCNAKIPTKRSLLPKFSERYESSEYLYEVAEMGLLEKCPGTDEYRDRFDYEIEVISKMGFADYFLIVWDLCVYAKRVGIYMGPGRGSVCGSLVAYCLGITKVDPIKFDLLFERFIDEERADDPDADLDFEDTRRGEMKEYAIQKYGQDNVAGISAYGLFRAKSVIKNLGNVFQIPYAEMNALTPLFESLDDIGDSVPGKKFLNEHPYILPIAERLENRTRTASAHPAGIVIADRRLTDICPLETRKDPNSDDRVLVSAFSHEEVAELGLIKLDFLGLKALAVINDCLKKIQQRHGIDVDDLSLSLDDQKVIDEFNTDSLLGVFQAEGGAYKNLVETIKIESFDDLVASTALVRPGALVTQGADYVKCKSGKQAVKYVHGLLEPILKPTWGAVLYQEQLMKIATDFAGFTKSESNGLRKIIGKKRDVSDFQKYYDKWIEGCTRHVSESVAQRLWENLEMTAGYMFNKSHSVAYSMLSYQTMFLKVYYPHEYIWALLKNEDKKENISAYLKEAKRMGLEIVEPDVNLSDEGFSIDGASIRFGLKNIKGCGPNAIKEIQDNRPYESYDHFVNTVKKSAVRKNVLENLEKVNAFASVRYESQYDSKEYFLEILDCSIYADDDPRYADIISQLNDVEDSNGLHVVRGLVKSIKRKPHYFRIELEDGSGVKSFFAPQDAPIKSKDYLVAVVGDKAVWTYEKWNEIDGKPMEAFLNGFHNVPAIPRGIGPFGHQKFMGILMGVKWFNTKKKTKMGNAWLYDQIDHEFVKITIFNSLYEKWNDKLVPLSNWVVKSDVNKPNIANDILPLNRYKELIGER